MNFAIKTVAASVLLASAGGAFSQSGETVKIAWLDPLSGLMAAVGTNQLKSWQFMAEEFNKKNAAGVKYEIIGIDNKLSPQETTSALRSAMDQGARYVVQGNGSGPALAIMDALEKHDPLQMSCLQLKGPGNPRGLFFCRPCGMVLSRI